jgi:RHS repeat-associated protein
VYDGYLQIANFEEAVTNSQLTTYNAQLFIWDPTELVATRPLVWNSDNCTSVYTHDGNKNVSEVINSDDVTVAHYEYTPFGAVAKQYGDCAAVNPWRFSSEYAEDALGLIYYNYRHYAVNYGNWYARDPLFESGSLNLYLFADNNSVNRIDFRGKCPALLLVPGVWVVVDVIVKATVAAAASVIIVEAADNIYQTYKEECGKCEASAIEVQREIRLRKRDDSKIDDCIQACLTTLPTGHRYGFPFFRCVRRCMEGR